MNKTVYFHPLLHSLDVRYVIISTVLLPLFVCALIKHLLMGIVLHSYLLPTRNGFSKNNTCLGAVFTQFSTIKLDKLTNIFS
jgi:hypothetical protein